MVDLPPLNDSDAQGTSGLRIRVGQPGHASKCSASRIRPHSHEHPTEASALDGPKKDRLIPVVNSSQSKGHA